MQHGNPIESKWAIDQLLALGYLEASGPEHIHLTDSGFEKSREIDRSIPIQDRILLLFYHGELITEVEDIRVSR